MIPFSHQKVAYVLSQALYYLCAISIFYLNLFSIFGGKCERQSYFHIYNIDNDVLKLERLRHNTHFLKLRTRTHMSNQPSQIIAENFNINRPRPIYVYRFFRSSSYIKFIQTTLERFLKKGSRVVSGLGT